MYPFSEREFFFKVKTDTIVRFVCEEGKATTLELDFGEGEPVRAKKIP
jgi:hypothetical protein